MGKRSGRLTVAFGAVVALVSVLVPSANAGTPVGGSQEQRNPIRITSDAGFTPENGIRGGSGTASDPYVISDWSLSSITIADTDRYVTIRDNAISGTLRLNWNGARVKVVNNTIGDLRVNENVKRTGGPTSGLIARNTIGTVGQLRHWDGIFEKNTVGSTSMNVPFLAHRAVNFDGFNGARFRNNKIFGYVDVRLHGHHHGSGFGDNSHDHNTMGPHAGHDMMDHTQRYHQVWVTGNEIHAPADSYALKYYDTGHAANDRTANSEPNPELEKPHIHYTRVHLNNNKLDGGIVVDVFNAEDQLHQEYARGIVEVKNNKISLRREALDTFEWRPGIDLNTARYMTMKVIGNEIRADFSGDPMETVFSGGDAGIRLRNFQTGDVILADNSVYDLYYGIYASQMTDDVFWWILGFRTGNVQQDIYWDSSVANAPEQRS